MARATIKDNTNRLEKHEEICAIRYESINARLKRLEYILITGAGSIIAFLIIFEFGIY